MSLIKNLMKWKTFTAIHQAVWDDIGEKFVKQFTLVSPLGATSKQQELDEKFAANEGGVAKVGGIRVSSSRTRFWELALKLCVWSSAHSSSKKLEYRPW